MFLRLQLVKYIRRTFPLSPTKTGIFDGWHVVPTGHVTP